MSPLGRGTVLAALVVVLTALSPAGAGASTFVVTTTNDEFGTGAGCALREAVEAANTDGVFGACAEVDQGADTIELAPGAFYPRGIPGGGAGDTNSSGDLDLQDEPLTVVGNGATIAGSSNPSGDRVLQLRGTIPFGGSISISNVTITAGAAPAPVNGGGGIRIDSGADVDLSNVTIAGNSSPGGPGGGIDLEGGGGTEVSLYLHDSTVSGNTSESSGGGINAEFEADAVLNNVTVTGNTADDDIDDPSFGGGGGVVARDAGSTITLANTIVAGNTDANPGTVVQPDCALLANGVVVSSGHNLIGDTQGCLWTAAGGDILNPASTGLSPALAPNGGSGRTHALLPGSPAIDAGDPAAPAALAYPACESASQNGLSRPQGSRCDIGAFELQQVPATPASKPAAPKAKKKKCKKRKGKKKKCKKRRK